jgi:hypothetical protein
MSSAYFPPERFRKSKYDDEKYLAIFTEKFDTGVKRTFSDNTKPQWVKFGSPRDNNTRCGVKDGKIRVQG